MKNRKIIYAIMGMGIWKQVIDEDKITINLIVPIIENMLMDSLRDVLSEYLDSNGKNFNKVRFITTKDEFTFRVKIDNTKIDYQVITETQMSKLLCYISLTINQVGIIRQRNVRLISLVEQYGGQLEMMNNSDLLTLNTLMKERILLWG